MNQKQDHSLSFEELTGGQGDFESPANPVQQTPVVPQPEAQLPVGYGIAEIPPTYAPNALPPQPHDYVAPVAPAGLPLPQSVQQAAIVPPASQPEAPTAVEHTSHVDPPKHALAAHWRPISYALGGFVLFLVLFNFQLIAQQIGYFLNPPKPAENTVLQDPNATTASTAIVPPESVIIIPKINVSAPIIYADSAADDEVMKDLQDGVVHYVNTAKPGEVGNAVIFGHSSNDWWEPGNFKFVFALLGKLEVGDQIQVNYSSRKYVYEVSEKKVVAPTEVSVLNPTADPTLTLITCTPPGTAWQRLIIVAKQVQPAPGTKQPIGEVAVKPPQPAKETPKPATPTEPKKVAVAKVQPLPGSAPTIGEQITKLFGNIASFFTPRSSDTTPKPPATPTKQQPRLPEVS